MLTEDYPGLITEGGTAAATQVDPATAVTQPYASPRVGDTQRIPAVNTDRSNRDGSWASSHRIATAGIAVVGLAGLAAAGFGIDKWVSSGGDVLPASYADAVASCDESVLSPVAYTGPNEVLPTTVGVSDNAQAAQYNQGLFHADSATATLGGRIDPGDESIMAALLGNPAVNGVSESNFSANVSAFYGEMTGSNKTTDLQEADSLCAENQYAMSETDSFSDSAIPAGEDYLVVNTQQNNLGEIDGATAVEHGASKVNIPGVLYSEEGVTKGVKHFFDVVVPKNDKGQVDVLGVGLEPNKSDSTTTTSTSNPQATSTGAGSQLPNGKGLGIGNSQAADTIGGTDKEGTNCVAGEPCSPGAPSPSNTATTPPFGNTPPASTATTPPTTPRPTTTSTTGEVVTTTTTSTVPATTSTTTATTQPPKGVDPTLGNTGNTGSSFNGS